MWLCLLDDQLLKLVGDLLVGGTETTGTTLRWLIIFLLRWPHVQRKMRQEIDSVYPDKTTPSVQVRSSSPGRDAYQNCDNIYPVRTTPYIQVRASFPTRDVHLNFVIYSQKTNPSVQARSSSPTRDVHENCDNIYPRQDHPLCSGKITVSCTSRPPPLFR